MAKPARTKNKDNARRAKKKISLLITDRVEYVDWKDVNLLRRFMSDRSKIRARRVTRFASIAPGTLECSRKCGRRAPLFGTGAHRLCTRPRVLHICLSGAARRVGGRAGGRVSVARSCCLA